MLSLSEWPVRASYIITFRDDHGHQRLANLVAVLNWLSEFQNLEVIVVEQDSVSALHTVKLPPNAKTFFARYEGAFNKSWGLNVGYRHAASDVLAFGDADMIMKGDILASCFDACDRQYDAINPYEHMIDLNPEESRIIINGHYDLEATRQIEELNRAGKGEFTCFCGGIFVIRRAVFEALGGFDERFLGWGGEDDAMTYKLVSLVKNLKTVQNQKAFHLWHERDPKAMYGHAHYQKNLRLISEYRSLGKARLLQWCQSQSQSIGNIEKYV